MLRVQTATNMFYHTNIQDSYGRWFCGWFRNKSLIQEQARSSYFCIRAGTYCNKPILRNELSHDTAKFGDVSGL